MNKKIYVSINDAIDSNLIEEADVLLFRGKSLVSHIIQKAGDSIYSHVGLATWSNGIKFYKDGSPALEITEFREWKGGRTVNLYTAYYNDLKERCIDIYRISNPLIRYKYNEKKGIIERKSLQLYGKDITNYMRSLTGLPYGWWRIFWLAWHKSPFIRLFNDVLYVSTDTNKIDPKKIYPVCSTAVAACFSKFGFDLVPNRTDEMCEPSDIARSGLLNYVFTLTE